MNEMIYIFSLDNPLNYYKVTRDWEEAIEYIKILKDFYYIVPEVATRQTYNKIRKATEAKNKKLREAYNRELNKQGIKANSWAEQNYRRGC